MRTIAVVFLGIGLGLAGCSTGTVPAGGTVTYKGQPVADASVIFTPAAGGEIAQGRTDVQGKFSLGTKAPHDGAAPGDYNVSVIPNLPTPAEGDYSEAPPPPFPQIYLDPLTSGLKAQVKGGNDNSFALELKD